MRRVLFLLSFYCFSSSGRPARLVPRDATPATIAAQPLFQFLFFGFCYFPSSCVFLYWIILRVMLVDQIQQIFHRRIILRLRFLNVLLQHFFQFFYSATILPNRDSHSQLRHILRLLHIAAYFLRLCGCPVNVKSCARQKKRTRR